MYVKCVYVRMCVNHACMHVCVCYNDDFHAREYAYEAGTFFLIHGHPKDEHV